MLSPKDSPLGKQLSQYVCLRITRLDDVDVGLFERDWNNTIYFFALNSDEKIYFRYGGRDSASPDTYLNVDSLELALRQGLQMHEQYPVGSTPPLASCVNPRFSSVFSWFAARAARIARIQLRILALSSHSGPINIRADNLWAH